ncbi:Dbl homology domain-containing protein [Cokeromyces recurvatus]|uniref:Dbl homology domain-containing protein n=1 Tax=Cokeromyces recurvatus TaxID=90255 RepID=UPI00221E6E12|nr:Dbl homology domain-containing protein [Cokeromyces recurvatus]KAI7897997.1 Dbl homology domain-containing protein [Cokeromyces recurvatus]
MTELLTTEETYLNHLLTIKNFYMDPLMHAAKRSQKKSSLVNLKDVEIIFAFIPQLIALSTILVEGLHETVTQYLEDDSKKHALCIGKIFCSLEPYFEIYIAYSVNFSKSRKYLSKASSNIVYRQLVQDTIRKKETNKMLLSDYMIAPIQRITRYCLLLTDLLKHSISSNPDYTYLDRTLKCLSALAFAMNNVQ